MKAKNVLVNLHPPPADIGLFVISKTRSSARRGLVASEELPESSIIRI